MLAIQQSRNAREQNKSDRYTTKILESLATKIIDRLSMVVTVYKHSSRSLHFLHRHRVDVGRRRLPAMAAIESLFWRKITRFLKEQNKKIGGYKKSCFSDCSNYFEVYGLGTEESVDCLFEYLFLFVIFYVLDIVADVVVVVLRKRMNYSLANTTGLDNEKKIFRRNTCLPTQYIVVPNKIYKAAGSKKIAMSRYLSRGRLCAYCTEQNRLPLIVTSHKMPTETTEFLGKTCRRSSVHGRGPSVHGCPVKGLLSMDDLRKSSVYKRPVIVPRPTEDL